MKVDQPSNTKEQHELDVDLARFNIELPRELNEWCRKKGKKNGYSKARFVRECVERIYNQEATNNVQFEQQVIIHLTRKVEELVEQLKDMGVKS